MERRSCCLLLALAAGPAAAADVVVQVDVVFTRAKPDAGKDEYALKFVRQDTKKSLDDDPITLQLNDVVTIQVTSPQADRAIQVDRWDGLEQWETKTKSGKTTTYTMEYYHHKPPIEARLGTQTVLTAKFGPGDAPKPQPVGTAAGPKTPIAAAGTKLQFVGLTSAASTKPALTHPGWPKNGWTREPVRVPKEADGTTWYTVTVTVSRN